jgi:hypothetical protein
MQPGTRVVSHAFTMDDWQADQVDSADGRTAYMWIVPAKVAGTWRIDAPGARGLEATLTQQYQKIGGSARADGKTVNLTNPTLRGDAIAFNIDGREFTGRVAGSRIEGAVKGGGADGKFTATRTGEAK